MSVTTGSKADAQDYLEVNKRSWDERAAAHAASTTYNLKAFTSSPTYISPSVRFDLPRLPSVENLDIVHLQCHIGTDTLSLARLGANTVTGLDFSSESLRQARLLANSTGDSGGFKLDFVEGDVYAAPTLLGHDEFDMVFTGIGALGWLPSISWWAQVVSSLLKPGGKFFIREGHPMLWTIDESITPDYPAEQLRVGLPYFESDRPIMNTEGIVYTDNDDTSINDLKDSDSKDVKTIEFNHGLGEIIQALISAGMRITSIEEHDCVPWNALPGRMEKMDVQGEEGMGTGMAEYRMAREEDRGKLPLSYTLQAVKE